MAVEHSKATTKAMPKTESVPMLLGVALLVAFVLAIAFSELVVESDASLRRKVLGKWQLCPKDQSCIETIFSGDGDMALKPLFGDMVMDYRFTWTIHNGEITLQLKGGGDWFSAANARVAQLLGISVAKQMNLPIRFESNSVMYIGGEKYVRIGNTTQ